MIPAIPNQARASQNIRRGMIRYDFNMVISPFLMLFDAILHLFRQVCARLGCVPCVFFMSQRGCRAACGWCHRRHHLPLTLCFGFELFLDVFGAYSGYLLVDVNVGCFFFWLFLMIDPARVLGLGGSARGKRPERIWKGWSRTRWHWRRGEILIISGTGSMS